MTTLLTQLKYAEEGDTGLKQLKCTDRCDKQLRVWTWPTFLNFKMHVVRLYLEHLWPVQYVCMLGIYLEHPPGAILFLCVSRPMPDPYFVNCADTCNHDTTDRKTPRASAAVPCAVSRKRGSLTPPANAVKGTSSTFLSGKQPIWTKNRLSTLQDKGLLTISRRHSWQSQNTASCC